MLAGGNGSRLGDLTRWQCKPALPFAGHFRNIDFTLSNCVNSRLRRVGVLTQYKAQTLINHLALSWNFLPRELGQFIDVWPAQQRVHARWYAGTADAVFQNLDLVRAQQARYTLILAGDHVYTMDYRPLLAQHAARGAAVTISCLPVPVGQAGSFGVLGLDARGRLTGFREKPDPLTLTDAGPTVSASMGIYVFDTDYLVRELERDARASASKHDFGCDILPAAVANRCAQAYTFAGPDGRPGYWRDVGTLEAYWQAHMDLLDERPAIDLADPDWPIWSAPQRLAPARLASDRQESASIDQSLLSAGVRVCGAAVTRCVLGPEVQVERGTVLWESVVLPGARIGGNCALRRVIVDGGVTIPDDFVVDGFERTAGARHGITLLTQDAVERIADRARAASAGPQVDAA